MSCFSVEDILSCSSSTSSRLVVLSEFIDIEVAGERLAQAEVAETWIVLKRDGAGRHASAAEHKIRKSQCTGLLSLEDLAAFFAAVFGPHLSKGSACHPTSGAHNTVTPPASPGTDITGVRSAQDQARDARVATIRARLEANKPVDAACVANLSGKNALRHVTLGTPLQDVLWQLSQEEVSCLVVSDAQEGEDGTVCGILTTSDVVAFLVAEAEKDSMLASIFANRLDLQSPSAAHQSVGIISGDKSTVDALIRMQSMQISELAVTDPVGGLISPISSRDISREILASTSRKILTTPLSSLVKDIRSRHPQGTDGKDAHPAISITSASSVGRAAALLLATSAGGVFITDESRVMTPPLSCVSASPGRELPFLSLDPDSMPLSKSASFSSAPAHKQRRASTHFWTTPRASFSSASNDPLTRPAMPSFALAASVPDGARESKSNHKFETALGSSVSSVPAKSAVTTMPAHLRTLSGQRIHRPRSLSLAQFSTEEAAMSRQLGAQVACRSQGAWTPSSLTPGSTASSASSPSSPFGSMLMAGFFGEAMQNGMPRHVVTMKTVLRSILAATASVVQEAVKA